MHAFRTHNCAELRKDHVGQTVKLSGWVNRKRDHGGLLFIDLRDTFGVTQIVIDSDSPLLGEVEKWRNEFVVMITGKVVERAAEVVNAKLPTGEIEVRVEAAEVLSTAEVIPFQVAEDDNGTTTYDTDIYGVSFNVNDSLSVSYQYGETDGYAGGVTAEFEGISAAYNIGPMAIKFTDNSGKNINGITSGASQNDDNRELNLSMSF